MKNYRFRVDAPSGAQGNKAAADLARRLQSIDEDATITRVKEDGSTLDLGAIVCAAFASPAIAEIAKVIGAWLGKNPESAIIFETGDGPSKMRIEAKGLKHDEIESIVAKALATVGH